MQSISVARDKTKVADFFKKIMMSVELKGCITWVGTKSVFFLSRSFLLTLTENLCHFLFKSYWVLSLYQLILNMLPWRQLEWLKFLHMYLLSCSGKSKYGCNLPYDYVIRVEEGYLSVTVWSYYWSRNAYGVNQFILIIKSLIS